MSEQVVEEGSYKGELQDLREATYTINVQLDMLGHSMDAMKRRQKKVLDIICCFGGIDGGHHKQWLLDEIVKTLTAGEYQDWVNKYETGETGPKEYEWDVGIAP